MHAAVVFLAGDKATQELEQQVPRAVFNVVGRNQDDHPRNIAYLMDREGEWRLSPRDIAYAYNPQGEWTDRHQMSLIGTYKIASPTPTL